MQYTTNLTAPLRNIFFTDSTWFKKLFLIIGGVFTLAIASQLVIPLQPVPITFQSATVILIAMAFGARYGSAVILSYLFCGAAGAPVFAGYSAGLMHFTGPTAGYLVGFVIAAYTAGLLAERGYGRTYLGALAVSLLAAAIIFVAGIPVLAMFVGWHNAISLGLMPFIITEPLKLLAVSAVIPRLWKSA